MDPSEPDSFYSYCSEFVPFLFLTKLTFSENEIYLNRFVHFSVHSTHVKVPMCYLLVGDRTDMVIITSTEMQPAAGPLRPAVSQTVVLPW